MEVVNLINVFQALQGMFHFRVVYVFWSSFEQDVGGSLDEIPTAPQDQKTDYNAGD